MARCAAVIVAGGTARRLGGQIKPLLQVDGATLLERVVAAVRSSVDEMWLVTAPLQQPHYRELCDRLSVTLITDRRHGMGPLAGLETALSATSAPSILLLGGDMPLLQPELLQLVRNMHPLADAVIPRIAGRSEPLCARYAARLLPLISEHLDRGQRSLVGLLHDIDAVWLDEAAWQSVDPHGNSFTNINTPDDLARLHRRFVALHPGLPTSANEE